MSVPVIGTREPPYLDEAVLQHILRPLALSRDTQRDAEQHRRTGAIQFAKRFGIAFCHASEQIGNMHRLAFRGQGCAACSMLISILNHDTLRKHPLATQRLRRV